MCVFWQGEGALTYAGKKRSPTVYGPHHTGKESLDINLLKTERHSAAPLACDDDAVPDWVTYNYSTCHSILRWLPSKLAKWIGDNMSAELQISAMTQDKWTVAELNQILANNLVPGGDGGHLRTFTTLQWECEYYNGRPKARCYPFAWTAMAFEAGIRRCESRYNMLYNMVYIMIYKA